MKQTDNLKLNLIEGTDIPAFAPFNENANKIDKVITELSADVKNQETSNESFKNNVNGIVKRLQDENNEFKSDVETLVSEVEISVDGTVKKGKLKRLVTKVKPSIVNNACFTPFVDVATNEIVSVNEKRVYIRNTFSNVSVNLTELIGLTDVSKILVLGAITYSDEYVDVTTGKINALPMGCRGISKLTYPNAPEDLYIMFEGERILTVAQENKGITSGGWQPSPTPAIPISDVYVVLTYVEFE